MLVGMLCHDQCHQPYRFLSFSSSSLSSFSSWQLFKSEKMSPNILAVCVAIKDISVCEMGFCQWPYQKMPDLNMCAKPMGPQN